MPADFENIASYYDLMYVDEESYAKETGQVCALAQKYGVPDGGRLLDIACGTGAQSRYFSQRYDVAGFDLSKAMIDVAQRNVPEAQFSVMDMLDFYFDEPFDIAVNLYGSIGFAPDLAAMQKSLACVYANLKPGGLFILTPWGTKETFRDGIFALSGRRGDFSWCRMESVRRFADDKVSVEMWHTVAHKFEIKQYHYIQQVSLWSEEEYLRSVANSGFALKERLDHEAFRMGAFVCLKEE